MAGNSTIQLLEVVDDASSLGDVAPALSTGGLSTSPAISIANDVMQALVNGGAQGQPFNFKWNRANTPPFALISYQQDYFIPGLNNLGWLESCWASQINQTSIPKQDMQVEVHKDLAVTSDVSGYAAKICWEQNDLMSVGTWGASPLGPTAGNPSGQTAVVGPNPSGCQNPGPSVIYTNPLGTLQTPINATTAIKDPNGNLWALTTFGTCGVTQPSWPTNPVYPIYGQVPQATATTVVDGSCVWTAINPKGQGFRISPLPSQTGVTWLVQPVGQMRAVRFKNLQQYLEPIPDDYEWAFKQGFFCECYRRNPDPKVRAKYPAEKQMWLESLEKAVAQGDRQMDDVGFYPGTNIMDTGCGISVNTPANPYGPWSTYGN